MADRNDKQWNLDNRVPQQWNLDNRVPLALIGAILIQSGGALWWAADINAKVEQFERQMAAAEPQIERIVRLETKMDAIFSALAEIKQIIQRPQPSRPP